MLIEERQGKQVGGRRWRDRARFALPHGNPVADPTGTSLPDGGLRRDGWLVLSLLAAVTAIAWFVCLWIGQNWNMAGMGSIAKVGAVGAAPPSLDATHAVLVSVIIWEAMMVAMMAPTAAPLFLAYARHGSIRRSRAETLAATAWFALGYQAIWAAVALVGVAMQWRLAQINWLDPMTLRVGRPIAGALMLVAGLYQLTPIKTRWLRLCQSPGQFIRQYGGFRADVGGAALLGMRQGAFCLGETWALTALLFVGGLMNMAWVAGLSAMILLEKVLPNTRIVTRLAALALVAAGDWMFFLALRSAGLT